MQLLTLEQVVELVALKGDRTQRMIGQVEGIYEQYARKIPDRPFGLITSIINDDGEPYGHTYFYDADDTPITREVFKVLFSTNPLVGFGTLNAELIDDVYAWSKQAYGPGQRTQGILDHIRKELKEIEAKPDDLEEWIDVILLALNGAQRLDRGGRKILEVLFAKMQKNARRNWPDWRKVDPNKAIEHVKTADVVDFSVQGVPPIVAPAGEIFKLREQYGSAMFETKAPTEKSVGVEAFYNEANTCGAGCRAAALAAPHDVLAKVKREKKVLALAAQLYDNSCDDTLIHCNRYPSWGELSQSQKQEYLVAAEAQIAQDQS